MPIGKLGSASLVLPYFKEKENCTAAYQDGNSEARLKKCSCHVIYARACVNKDFVHSGSIGLIYGKHTRYVISDYIHLCNEKGKFYIMVLARMLLHNTVCFKES